MQFLKKVSIEDLLGDTMAGKGNGLWTDIDVSTYYKEFELYLSYSNLKKVECIRKFYEGTEEEKQPDYLDTIINELANKLCGALKKNGAVVTAVHVPESFFKTSSDKSDSEIFSTNYISLCEAIFHEKSYNCLEFCIKLADRINEKQYKKINDTRGKEDTKIERPVIVIVHSGCIKGCTEMDGKYECIKVCTETEEKDNWISEYGKERISAFIEKLRRINLKNHVRIAVENITPYYSWESLSLGENTSAEKQTDRKVLDRSETGRNCGWRSGREQREIIHFLEQLNRQLGKEKDNSGGSDSKLSFGLCIDFCHIMASYILKEEVSWAENEKLCKAIDSYFQVFDDKVRERIYLFHVSKLGENGGHGALFRFPENGEVAGGDMETGRMREDDRLLVEKIQQICYHYAPGAPITLEMADGQDKEKACRNFDETMYYFSAMHTRGYFAELLGAKDNHELKTFFENLFWVYASDGRDYFTLGQKAWQLKEYILKNTNIESQGRPDRETPFGFHFDMQKEKAALFRLKAYIYYTRFCNLGTFLAENYYRNLTFLGNKEKDFGLAMKYFMFNDRMKQCVYTGVAYKFNINFLPRVENFYRLNDGIVDAEVTKLKIDTQTSINQEYGIFSFIAEAIRNQINGNGKLSLFSVGQNFGQCLFKYLNPNAIGWSLRIYKNVPVNYVEFNKEKYSIPAFLQIQNTLDCTALEYDFAIDISRFRKGQKGSKNAEQKERQGNESRNRDTSSLEGFFANVTKIGVCEERVASISDGEIVLTKLPDKYDGDSGLLGEYKLTAAEGMLLKKAYLDYLGDGKDKEKSTYRYTALKMEIDEAVRKFNEIEEWKIRKAVDMLDEINKIGESESVNRIMEIVHEYAGEKKDGNWKEAHELLEKEPYKGGDQNEIFRMIYKYIERERRGTEDGKQL